MSESIETYLERIDRFLQKQPEGEYILISQVATNADKFIEAIKYLIRYENKNYEFNSTYTKVRRLSNEILPSKPCKEAKLNDISEQLPETHNEEDEREPEEGSTHLA
jgi:hypothetical protein